MNCPPKLARTLAAIANLGIDRARTAARDGDAERAVVEIDHSHSLPGLMASYSGDGLNRYWRIDREIFISRTDPEDLRGWEPLWNELLPAVDQSGPSAPTAPDVADAAAMQYGGGESNGRLMRDYDEEGPIPVFPPAARDAWGKYIIPGEEEMRARRAAAERRRRLREKLDAESDEEEPNEDQWREFLERLGVKMDPAPSRGGE